MQRMTAKVEEVCNLGIYLEMHIGLTEPSYIIPNLKVYKHTI